VKTYRDLINDIPIKHLRSQIISLGWRLVHLYYDELSNEDRLAIEKGLTHEERDSFELNFLGGTQEASACEWAIGKLTHNLLPDNSMKQRAICKNCKYIKTQGYGDTLSSLWECTKYQDLDYITGNPKYDRCTDRNYNGKCRDYSPREK